MTRRKYSYQDSVNLGQSPPCSIELEANVLGALMLYPSSFINVSGILTVDAFYKEEHKDIYRSIVNVSTEKDTCDPSLVATDLDKRGRLSDVGGIFYLTQLTDPIVSDTNITFWAKTLLDKYVLREQIRMGVEQVRAAFEPNADATNAVQLASRNADQLTSIWISRNNAETFHNPFDETIDDLKKRCENSSKGVLTGVKTPLVEMDRMLNGFQKTDLIILAGRPGMGKTSVALAAAYAAAKSGVPVKFFSLEMSRVQLMYKLIMAASGVDSERVRMGSLTDQDWSKISLISEDLKRLPIEIDDTPGASPDYIFGTTKLSVKKGKCGIVFIDYLGLINYHLQGNGKNDDIGDITKRMKHLAKSAEVPVVLLSQLSRKVEERPSKKPMLQDLRDCLSTDTSMIYTEKSFQSNSNSRINLLSLHSKSNLITMQSEDIKKTENVVYRLKLGTGRFIDCTENHNILTTDGYKKLKDIINSDSIAVAKGWCSGTVGTYVGESRFIGWMIGNGCMYGYNSPSFITNDQETSDQFCDYIQSRFGFHPQNHPHYRSKVYQWDLTHSAVRTKEGNRVTTWLRENDLWGKKAKDKCIPEWFMERADEQSICELLQGLYETDGSVSVGKAIMVKYATTSLLLANQIMYLLAKIGVVAFIDDGYTSSVATTPCYSIAINSFEMIDLFRSKVKLCGEKGRRIATVTYKRKSLWGNKIGYNTTLRVQNTLNTLGVKTSIARVQSHGGRRLTIGSLIDIIKAVGSEKLKDFEWLCSDHIYWDTIDSITKIGVVDVFDRSVPVTNNYIVNGIIVHNSGSVEQDADLVMFVYRPEYYGLCDSSGNEIKNKGQILIEKHRNGPIGSCFFGYNNSLTKIWDIGDSYQSGTELEKTPF